MKKVILLATTAIIFGIIGIIALGVLNLGTLIKTVTETVGPKLTKTEVKLDSADVAIMSGEGTLSGFLLGNPSGYTLPSAVECNTVRIRVVKDSLSTDKIIIDEIFVDSPVIGYEKRGKTDNFQTILNNIKQVVAQDQQQESTDSSSETGAEKKIQINNFIVRNGKINLAGDMLELFGNKGTGIALPNIHLKDIGKDKDTTPAEAFSIILGELTGNVTGSVLEVGKELKKVMGKAMEDVSKTLEEATKDPTKLENLGKGLEDATKDLGGTIDGIFNQ